MYIMHYYSEYQLTTTDIYGLQVQVITLISTGVKIVTDAYCGHQVKNNQ